MPSVLFRAEISIDRLSKSGQGVGRLEGRSVFVDGALPSERVLVEIADSGKVPRGRLLEVLCASASRRASPCALSERCGGCDWLHLGEEEQRRAKLEIVLSALEHLAGISRSEIQVLPAHVCRRQLGYRRRAVLHLRAGRLCLFGRRSHNSVPLDRCPAMVPRLSELLVPLGAKLARLEKEAGSVHLLAEGEAASFAVFLSGSVRPSQIEICRRAVSELGLKGAVLVPRSGPARLIGQPGLADEASAPLRIRPDVFAQANAEANAALRLAVVERLGVRQGERILELHCGNGNLTFAIAAAGAEVLAVESSPSALQLARERGGEGAAAVRFIQGEGSSVCLALAREGARFDALLADPPRAGVPGIGSAAQKLGCQRVVYVSCDPAALARDAENLKACGYSPKELQLIDMFPQTRHAEVVVAFARQSPRVS